VNDTRITRAELRDGDEIRVGRTRIRVAASPPAMGPDPKTLEVARPDPPIPEIGQPPRATRESPPAGPTPSPPEHHPPPPSHPVCSACGTDLGDLATAEGPDTDLTDPHYLCRICERIALEARADIEELDGYRIIGHLGRGGMGVVYKAVHEQNRLLVAIKRMLHRTSLEERELRLFEREIAVQSGVRHPNLARLLDHGRDCGCSYLVVEYLAGGDASRLVRDVFGGPLPIPLAIRIGLEVLDGVETLHRDGIVHRDLKPQNIVLTRKIENRFGTAKITDYGLAKPFEDAGNSLFDLSRDNEAAGSLKFMPPEQILDYRNVRPPADVYAIGVSLYYMLTGRFTVDWTDRSATAAGGTAAGLTRNPIESLIEDDPVPILERRNDLPVSIARVIDTAVTKELSGRYDSAARFRHELLSAALEAGLS